jgi:hypothetical protein
MDGAASQARSTGGLITGGLITGSLITGSLITGSPINGSLGANASDKLLVAMYDSNLYNIGARDSC